jgi:hypothetical protein
MDDHGKRSFRKSHRTHFQGQETRDLSPITQAPPKPGSAVRLTANPLRTGQVKGEAGEGGGAAAPAPLAI